MTSSLTQRTAGAGYATDVMFDDMKQVLTAEAQALLKQAEHITPSFFEAVETMAAAEGRVIITGMGKSGHVGRKIAATMASTGCPAIFIHPGEASHGDLGMITPKDVVLAISNSGEAPELGDILHYCKRFDIPLIALTSKPASTLAKNATCVVEMVQEPEACPNGLAPTTSTTLSMAIGDALAVALMRRAEFQAHDFRVFHPGGKLGKQLLRAENAMVAFKDLPIVPSDALMQDVLLAMSSKNFGCAIICDDQQKLLGFISDGDLRRHLERGEKILETSAQEIMTTSPKSVAPDSMAAEALKIMNTYSITQLLVLDGDRIVGLLRLHDLMRAGLA